MTKARFQVSRRAFLRAAAAAGVAAALPPRSSRAADARIDVLASEPIGTVTADLYGHFVEHLGGVVYGGIWVGENSRIPNTGGIRQAIVDHMRRLPAGPIRWPGGCFADSYDWRDGVGGAAQRPTRTNFWANDMASLPDGPPSTIPIASAPTSSCASAAWPAARPTWPRISAACPRATSISGSSTCNSPAGSTSGARLREQGG